MMFNVASEESYHDNEIIVREGSSGDWVYVVLSGSVEISKMVGGRRSVLGVLQPGEIFGELGFLGGIKRSATARALGETTLGIIDRTSLDSEFNKLSTDFRTIVLAIVERFKKMIDRASSFSSRKESRIPKTLAVAFKDRQSFIKAYTGNVSAGGIFIRTERPLKRGEQFLLNLQLPDIADALTIKCEVAWARKQEGDIGGRPPGMGAKFLEMREADRKILGSYLKAVMEK
jgi:uncharacterized protein (TIGR02266 family)